MTIAKHTLHFVLNALWIVATTIRIWHLRFLFQLSVIGIVQSQIICLFNVNAVVIIHFYKDFRLHL